MDEQNLNFAIIISKFNQEITNKLLEATITRLTEQQIPQNKVKTFFVPGAVELPLIAKKLANSKKFDAIICLGAVIRGQTDHYDYVCQQVSYGCQRVALDEDLPIIFGILTTHNIQQALDRVNGKHSNKGVAIADAALEMAKLSLKINCL